LALWLCTALAAQQNQNPPEPPEEDEALKPKEYSLNPVQAKKEMTAGNFYFKKGSYRAAATRYLEATRWDPGLPEAFLKWGEASEKAKDFRSAREAYSKYIEMSGDTKTNAELKAKMAQWPPSPEPPAIKKTEPLDSVPNLNQPTPPPPLRIRQRR
jgi:tetratricopeptide (TPR) repeat protein